MTQPFYVGPEQLVRDKSEYARRNIARGRSVVALSFAGGILFVAENPSTSLHKISEIYDRIGFAAIGRYHEFESLRIAGVNYADVRGYSYDRRDVTGRGLANQYAQLLGANFIESAKPFEVEAVVAEIGVTPAQDSMYRLTFDGSVVQESGFLAMGGQAEAITTSLREHYDASLSIADTMRVALDALQAGTTAGAGSSAPGGSSAGAGGNGGTPPPRLNASSLEVGLLDRTKPRRTFRRITGQALTDLVEAAGGSSEPGEQSDSANPE